MDRPSSGARRYGTPLAVVDPSAVLAGPARRVAALLRVTRQIAQRVTRDPYSIVPVRRFRSYAALCTAVVMGRLASGGGGAGISQVPRWPVGRGRKR